MTVASAFQGVNADYGIAIEESGPRFPAIQATVYQPRTMSEKVSLCLSEESFDMLEAEQGLALGCTPEVCNFGDEDQTMWVLPELCRFVVMGIPRMFALHKESKEISGLTRGEKLATVGKVTITRLTLAMMRPDGEFVLDADGKPQLFTLKLSSTKTALVSGDKYDPEFKSLTDLNKALQVHFKKPRTGLTHLVSVGLAAIPRKFTSKSSNESSVGIMFALGTGAKPLPEHQQLMSYELLKDPEVLAMIQDPFHLKDRDNATGNSADSSSEDAPSSDYDSIPF